MYAHQFKVLMEWLLDKGREDADSRAIALTLTRELISSVDNDGEQLIEQLLPKLLSGFPEIVWPLLGQAIACDRKTSWRFEHLLGDTFSTPDREDPAILRLPQDTLFAWCHAQPDVGQRSSPWWLQS